MLQVFERIMIKSFLVISNFFPNFKLLHYYVDLLIPFRDTSVLSLFFVFSLSCFSHCASAEVRCSRTKRTEWKRLLKSKYVQHAMLMSCNMLLEYFLSTWPLLAVRQDSPLPD